MKMNWKGFGRKRTWPNFKVVSRHSLGGTEENHEKLNQHPIAMAKNRTSDLTKRTQY
jgi:hypothetical protein